MIDQQYDELTRRMLDDAADQIEKGPDNEDTLVFMSNTLSDCATATDAHAEGVEMSAQTFKALCRVLHAIRSRIDVAIARPET
ncbi:hypothetical protein KBI52_21840 [Microvirga sp. HBU67558]|uniref:hypothetical protein n=1 Tax=Microvirga TaxID=186650 RepID=UPI001B393E92|nr:MULTISPECIES: hypothetical protein [unclassified Microvirga]MBQ0822833.1 hypothetical protein [Microvirga sp. HBU67558]